MRDRSGHGQWLAHVSAKRAQADAHPPTHMHAHTHSYYLSNGSPVQCNDPKLGFGDGCYNCTASKVCAIHARNVLKQGHAWKDSIRTLLGERIANASTLLLCLKNIGVHACSCSRGTRTHRFLPKYTHVHMYARAHPTVHASDECHGIHYRHQWSRRVVRGLLGHWLHRVRQHLVHQDHPAVRHQLYHRAHCSLLRRCRRRRPHVQGDPCHLSAQAVDPVRSKAWWRSELLVRLHQLEPWALLSDQHYAGLRPFAVLQRIRRHPRQLSGLRSRQWRLSVCQCM